MSNGATFKAVGKTNAYSAPTSSPAAGVQLDGHTSGEMAVKIYNPDTTNFAWVAFGSSATDAQTNAVLPVAGTGQYGIQIPPASIVYETVSATNFFSFLASTGAITLYVTAGQWV